MRLRRGIRFIATLLILGAAGWWVNSSFLAPAPDVAIRSQATGSAQEKLVNGEMTDALADIQRGLEALPGDWELLVWESVLIEKLSGSGEERMAQALAAGTQPDVWIVQGMVALLVDAPQMALAAGTQVIEHTPDAPQGYFLVAQSHEKLGRVDEALRYYQEAAAIAEADANHYAVYVAARERIAALT